MGKVIQFPKTKDDSKNIIKEEMSKFGLKQSPETKVFSYKMECPRCGSTKFADVGFIDYFECADKNCKFTFDSVQDLKDKKIY